jgi:hypothetical protein
LLGLVVAILLGSGPGAAPAGATGLVVAKLTDRSGKKLGERARDALMRALAEQGADLMPLERYLRTARQKRIPPKRLDQPRSIQRLCGALGLSGVVLGSASRARGGYSLSFRLVGRDGRTLWSETYRSKKPVLDARRAAHAAERILALSGGPAAISRAPEPESEPERPELEDPPALAAAEPAPAPWAEPPEPPPRKEPAPRPTVRAEAESEPELPGELSGPVPDALLGVGVSMHLRSGLEPRHAASLFPGLRIDGLLLLGAFLDRPHARDLGLRFDVDFSLGLAYGYASTNETWSASQVQWGVDLVYRLAFDAPTRPTLLIALGFGGTSCRIDSSDPRVLDAAYLYPRLGFDFGLGLVERYLDLRVGLGFLVPVLPGGELGGTGWGWRLAAGVDSTLFDFLLVGLGYEILQVRLSEDAMGSTSDTYQGFYLRLGYAHR